MDADAIAWHARTTEECAASLDVDPGGITSAEARGRLARYGPNRLEPEPATPRWRIFLRQFQSPLIAILVIAGVVAMVLDHAEDAVFIGAVLLINAVIGFVNESRAEREVMALASLVRVRARVKRDGHALDVDGEEVVPGDLLLLESGARICADVRLVDAQSLRVDEALLTGESTPILKDAGAVVDQGTALADRTNMAFAGSVVISGRAAGLVVATATGTEVGAIATSLAAIDAAQPPLVLAMARFARVIGWVALAMIGLIIPLGLAWRQPLDEVVLAGVALAVSAVPEGLPIALTVALALAVSRMAKRGVVIRHLPAVEALGSCGVIATDKTGTLTRNELTVERLMLGGSSVAVSGTGYRPEGEVQTHEGARDTARLERLVRAACLANEGSLARDAEQPDAWVWSGDPTDVALLSLGIKSGLDLDALRADHPQRAAIPFEAEHRFAASFHARAGGALVCVKGAPEQVLAMCSAEPGPDGGALVPVDRERVQRAVEALMRDGYRVIAVADTESEAAPPVTEPPAPTDLAFLGLVAMTDPPREEVPDAIAQCRRAGIHVVMITGDHATTAAVIAERIGLGAPGDPVLHGAELAGLDDATLAATIDRYAVIARATPDDKLRVVRAWQARGVWVAVTGDGVNDAPALRQANIGVAMGKSGTDVAREASELVITDDNFASIVAGVEEGRVAYDNVRKVIYLLVSTGAGEVVLVLSALVLGLGVPLTAVQLLWLNLVTNGIQDVALAFEAAEPGVLERPPRDPKERIFDRMMIERTLLAALVFGVIGLATWWWCLRNGLTTDEARNLVVQLFVMFEVFHIGNARSERVSLLRLSPLKNKPLLLGTATALGIHLAALHTPLFQRLLGIEPISLAQWAVLAALASSVVFALEIHKAVRRRM